MIEVNFPTFFTKRVKSNRAIEQSSNRAIEQSSNRHNNFKFIVVFMFAILFITSLPKEAKASQDSVVASIVIDSTSMSPEISYHLGDTVNFTLYFHTTFSDTCLIRSLFHGGVKPIINGQIDSIIYEKNYLEAGKHSKSFTLLIQENHSAEFGIFMKLPNTMDGNTNLVNFQGSFKYIDSTQEIYWDPTIWNEIDDQGEWAAYHTTSCPITLNDAYIHISGKILMEDWSEGTTINGIQTEILTGEQIGGWKWPRQSPNDYPRLKSAYNQVWLFFSSGSPSDLTHPIPYGPLSDPIEHVHYAKCDDQGNFYFEFNYNRGAVDCQTHQQATITLFIAKENEVLWLESPTDHIIIPGVKNIYDPSRPVRFYKIQNSIFTGYLPPSLIFEDVHFGPDDPLDPYAKWVAFKEYIRGEGLDQTILRYATMSRVFLQDRFSEWDLINNQSVHIPPQVHIIRKKHWAPGQYYRYNNRIDIDNGYCNNQLIPHEYGHYFDDYSNPNSFGGIYTESFAQFFSWAFRVWDKNNFSDFAGITDDCEIGPFCTQDTLLPNGEWIRTRNRFGNISKKPMLENRFSCYLWNLYDSKNEWSFSPLTYFEGKNNDDVDFQRPYNGGREILDFWINTSLENRNSSTLFHNAFRAKYNNDTPLQESIDAIYNFMEFNPDTAFAQYTNTMPELLENTPVWMKSPNLDLAYNITHISEEPSHYLLTYSWNNTHSYYPPPVTDYVYRVWVTEGDPPIERERGVRHHFAEYPNKEDAVEIYFKWYEGGYWTDIHRIRPLTYPGSWSENVWDPILEMWYKASTFNFKGGDSYIPVIAHLWPGMKKPINENQTSVYKYRQIDNVVQLTLNSPLNNIQADLYSLDGKYIGNLYNSQPNGNMISIDLSNKQLPHYQIMFIRFTIIDNNNNVLTEVEKIILN